MTSYVFISILQTLIIRAKVSCVQEVEASDKGCKMKVVILLSLFVIASALDFPEETEWEQWKKAHGKQYSSDSEELHRHIVWQANKKYIDQHNSQSSVFGYTLAMNQFGDLESSEFNHLYKGYRQSPNGKRSGKPFVPSTSVKDLPVTVDWRPKGYVTPVKNQGQCGSCWAFSATGSLEGQHFNVTGKLVSLSEQNLVDCSTAEGNMGCNGGLPDQAFQYIIKVGGIDTEASYPYKGENENCKFSKANIGSNCTAYVDVKKDSEIDLQTASATIGPISVGIDASHIGFQFYVGGVYDPIFCSKTDLDHGVLVVGYGVFDGKDYWLVKNSWGVDWGLKGYIMMARNKDNKCGIATEASYPIVTA